MFKIVLALHILAAVFAIGPLVHAASTAARGVRERDGAAVAGSVRLLRIYSAASVVVIVLGFALMSTTSDYTHKRTAEFSATWIWLSLLLWFIALGVVDGVVVRGLKQAGARIASASAGGAGSDGPNALVGRVAAGGGVVALIFAAIVFLMVYQPGH